MTPEELLVERIQFMESDMPEWMWEFTRRFKEADDFYEMIILQNDFKKEAYRRGVELWSR